MTGFRIALVAPPWLTVPPQGYGGIEWVVSHLADGLVRRGWDVTLYAPGGSRSEAKVVCPFPEPLGTASIGQLYPELVQALSCYVEAERYDLVHDHCGLAGPALGAFSPVPVVVTLHGAFVPGLNRVWELIGDRVAFVAISEAQRAGMPNLRYLATIPNGIDVDAFPYRSRKDGYLAFVGRFSPEKGANIAVEVAHRLGLPLVLAGKSAEPHEKEFLEREVLPALDAKDDYRGEVSEEEKREILAHARCVLFPVRWPEPFGLVMVEAMACGTPVVAFRQGAVPEVVSGGRTGFVVDTIEEMVAAVERIGEIDPAACRKEAERRFSASAMVEAYERAYLKLLGAEG